MQGVAHQQQQLNSETGDVQHDWSQRICTHCGKGTV